MRLPKPLGDGGVHHPAQGLGLVDLFGDTLSAKRCFELEVRLPKPLVDGGVHHPVQGLGLVDFLGGTLST